MHSRKLAKWVAIIVLVGTGVANAQEMPAFPWFTQGWHQYQRSMAYNIAFNNAAIECQNWGMTLDRNQITVNYSWVTIDPGYHVASMYYYCIDPPPSYWKRNINDVEGGYDCNPGVALASAEQAGREACTLLEPLGEWFMGSSVITGVSQLGSGSCGHGSWGANPAYQYRIRPECWLEQP